MDQCNSTVRVTAGPAEAERTRLSLAPVICQLSSAVSHRSSCVAAEIAAVEGEIAALVNSRAALIPQVYQHLVQAGGKRLRPRLTLLSAQALGDCSDRAILFAAMVEITHLASLLHDDIVDNAALRRGQPAVHVRWSNGVAVLVADWLVARTYSELLGRGETEAVGILSRTVRQMCEAELSQVERRSQGWQLSEEACLEVIASKTGALMAAACELGGLAADGSPDELAALHRFGMDMGTAFQLQDDLLDLTGDPAVLGKQVGADIAMGQPTLPIVYALEHSTDGLLARLQAAVRVSSPEELDLTHLRSLVDQAGGIAYTQRTAADFVHRATESLGALPPGPAVDELASLAEQALDRST